MYDGKDPDKIKVRMNTSLSETMYLRPSSESYPSKNDGKREIKTGRMAVMYLAGMANIYNTDGDSKKVSRVKDIVFTGPNLLFNVLIGAVFSN